MCAGVCVLGEKLFAVGGYDGSGYLSLVESYDNREKTWRQVASLNTHRAGRQTYKVNHDAVAAIRSFYFQQLPCQLPMQDWIKFGFFSGLGIRSFAHSLISLKSNERL